MNYSNTVSLLPFFNMEKRVSIMGLEARSER